MSSRSDNDSAAENLRLSLPLMARYDIPVSPRNYAVFFDYVSGTNAELVSAFDDLVEKGHVIDQDAVNQLYRQFVSTFDEERFDGARKTLRSIVADLGETVVSADGEVSRFENALLEGAEQLSSSRSADEVRTLLDALRDETHKVRAVSNELCDRLEESRRQAEALRAELERAREEAITDSLTGLANRKAFDFALDALREEMDDKSHGLLMCDIDEFKRVNDRFGHLIGDKVIRFVANTMKECVKGKDLVARYGGEEFAILLPDTPLEGAAAVANAIRRTIESGKLVRADTGESLGTVTVSVGVAVLREGEDNESFVGRADAALYAAKHSGRNRVVVEDEGQAAATGTHG